MEKKWVSFLAFLKSGVRNSSGFKNNFNAYHSRPQCVKSCTKPLLFISESAVNVHMHVRDTALGFYCTSRRLNTYWMYLPAHAYSRWQFISLVKEPPLLEEPPICFYQGMRLEPYWYPSQIHLWAALGHWRENANWRDVYETIVAYILVNVCLICFFFSPFSCMHFMGLCVMSWSILRLMILEVFVLYLIIVNKSDIPLISHCLGERRSNKI